MTRGHLLTLCALGLLAGLAACTSAAKPQADNSAHLQPMQVMTPGVTGAHCLLQAGSSNYATAAGSRIMVRRSPDTMKVSCFKGPHMVGHTSVKPTVAPREAQQAGRGGSFCGSCTYPETISVVLAMRPSSVRRDNVTIMQ